MNSGGRRKVSGAGPGINCLALDVVLLDVGQYMYSTCLGEKQVLGSFLRSSSPNYLHAEVGSLSPALISHNPSLILPSEEQTTADPSKPATPHSLSTFSKTKGKPGLNNAPGESKNATIALSLCTEGTGDQKG
ncbi:hypothetical protein Baya_16289 [Bagarius yarrelli]|uniref:Uncharacterized protein n=1 Tax=Bagarius yarrelli TaxID=175774 RepID=A0A556VV64_BAGYA|nr:hypothetical protein Baya_16289 [Bagarius yarrelli]